MADRSGRLARFSESLQEDGFASEVVAAGDPPSPTLLVSLTDDDGQPAWQLEISFVPGMAAQLDHFSLAQFFVAVAGDVAPANLPALREAVVALNAQLPIVGFGVTTEPPAAIFREVVMLPPDSETASRMVTQTTWLVTYVLSLFAGVVAEVATRGTPFAEAIRGHPQAALFA